MQITIRPTKQLIELDHCGGNLRTAARLWIGTTENGTEVQVLIVRVAAPSAGNESEFLRALLKTPAPIPAVEAFPLRMLI